MALRAHEAQPHLLVQEHLVEVVHLQVVAAVEILPLRLRLDDPAGVELEALDTESDELPQMVEPGVGPLGHVARPALANGDLPLLLLRQVVVAAEPEEQLIVHPAESAWKFHSCGCQVVLNRVRLHSFSCEKS